MKVKELIEELENYGLDRDVVMVYPENQGKNRFKEFDVENHIVFNYLGYYEGEFGMPVYIPVELIGSEEHPRAEKRLCVMLWR
jgi:hypothetical protein